MASLFVVASYSVSVNNVHTVCNSSQSCRKPIMTDKVTLVAFRRIILLDYGWISKLPSYMDLIYHITVGCQ